MQSMIDPASIEKGAQVETKKILIMCAGGIRNIVFWPSQNMLVVHEYETRRKIELGYSSSRILEILIDRADVIVSRDDIFAFAWPDRIVGQNSLNQAISTIRELLGDEEHRAIIQTIPRRGYQFNSGFLASPGQIVASDDVAPAPLEVKSRGEQAPRIRFSRLAMGWGREKGLMVIAILLTATFFLRIDWNLWLQPDFVKEIEPHGLLTVWYTGANPEEVKRLRESTATVRERMLNLLEVPGTVIFNTMHSFYEIICISGSTVEFVSVHKSRLFTLTDEQLGRCLN